ncbi:MAG: hypothetical protein HQK54_11315, partial [Oligoflexales bacterium]|nr:hypothetical protein [Oligoflexales bacterium]
QDTSIEILNFLRRLIQPMEIASSLRQVKEEHLPEDQREKVWFKGSGGTDLFLWKNQDQKLEAWQFFHGDEFAEWSQAEGLFTGRKAKVLLSSNNTSMSNPEGVTVRDSTIDGHLKQFCLDLFSAFDSEYKEELLESLAG